MKDAVIVSTARTPIGRAFRGSLNNIVAGGQENISAVQSPYFDWTVKEQDPAVIAKAQHAYMSMIQTAEFVATKYGISRAMQDKYALESQQRTAAAQRDGRFDAEI